MWATPKARKSCKDIFQGYMKVNNCKPRFLYPEKLSLKIDIEKKKRIIPRQTQLRATPDNESQPFRKYSAQRMKKAFHPWEYRNKHISWDEQSNTGGVSKESIISNWGIQRSTHTNIEGRRKKKTAITQPTKPTTNKIIVNSKSLSTIT